MCWRLSGCMIEWKGHLLVKTTKAAIRSDILYLFGQGKSREKTKQPASHNVPFFSFRLCLQFMAPYLELLGFLRWGQSPRKSLQKNNWKKSFLCNFVCGSILVEGKLVERKIMSGVKFMKPICCSYKLAWLFKSVVCCIYFLPSAELNHRHLVLFSQG